ncbi:leucine dehydrogenase (plasmid) [Legionella adelaidensis]|uniref:Leucine dehydrogenase n=2 Tax=Legionella adelaidensis TaxID=45056 RepID=A0A0W0R4Y3_9GAMM|nr:amino acid dehydrogenase [Legionella adelaidensis]KTC66148.1 leucine dehydrogenase [Legionella adelaidensis]VEH85660.1 leucine dehydrogenase [Legionella adelaidensis]
MSIDTLKTPDLGTTLQGDFLDYALSHSFGDIHCRVDEKTGMKAIIAIHNTKLGPALGGCRFIYYPDTAAALYDVMRLARGMSYKAALANLPLGGGKAVIIQPAQPYDREGYLRSFGKFVNDLGGRYITALDSGTQLADMDIIGEHTPYIASLSRYDGDPSPYTAKGVLRGIEAAVAFKLGKDSLKGLHIAIQGLGHVGYPLARSLHELGATLSVADVDPTRTDLAANEFGANVYSTEDIHKVPCDIFSPCALGAVINDQSINHLQTTIIAGAANNQLAHTYHGQRLHDKGILYATDYVINAGGLMFAASKYLHIHEDDLNDQITGIGKTLSEIFARSQRENKPPSEIADAIAKEKLS